LEYYLKYFELAENTFKAEELLVSYDQLAKLYQIRREYSNAIDYKNKELELAQKIYDSSSSYFLNCFLFISPLYRMIENYDKGLYFADKALDFLKSNKEQDEIHLAEAYFEIAHNSWKLQKVERARDAFEKCLVFKEKLLGLSHVEVADLYFNLGLVNLETNNFENSVSYFTKILDLRIDLKL
jgi:tetratricopeptide (TPR) repeat protein